MTRNDSSSGDSSENRENDSTLTGPSASRRRVLQMGSVLGSMGMLSAASSATGAPTTQSESVPDGKQFDNLVGAYYYGWYVPEKGRHWDRDLGTADGRSHTPVLGEYSSHDQETVDQHIAWALQHGVNWFNCTWWGPDTNSDEALRNYLLESQHADKMNFSLLYEPWHHDAMEGWTDWGSSEIRELLREDLQYIDDEFLGDPNWLRIDGRPVVYFWRNHTYTGDVTGAFEDAISTLDHEPYIIGSEPSHSAAFDAFANFATVEHSTTDWDTYIQHSIERRIAHKKQGEYGTDQLYIPSVQPGASWSNPDHMEVAQIDHNESKFREACQVMAEAMDEDVPAAIVCSFNEWHEGSTLEPAEEYGTSALEVVEEELQGATPGGDLLTEEYARVRFEFNDIARIDGDSSRPLALWLGSVRLEAADGSEILSDDINPDTEPGFQTDPAMSGALGYWIGSPLRTGSLIFKRSDLEAAETLVITGNGNSNSQDLEADVFVNGKRITTLDIVADNQKYDISIPDDIPDHPDNSDDSDEPEEQAPYEGPHSVPGTLEAEHFDTGGEGVAYHDTTGDHYGDDYRSDEAVDIKPASEHDYTVGWIEQGEWLEYTVQVDSDGDYDLAVRVASPSGGSLAVSAEGSSVSTSFDETGGWEEWTTVDLGTLSLSAGETVIRVEATDSHWNLNYLEFTATDDGSDDGNKTVEEGVYKLVNVNSGKVLDVDGGSTDHGATLQQWGYNGSQNQHWEVTYLGDGEYGLLAQHSGKAADVENVSTDNGADIHQWGWQVDDNQLWYIDDLDGGEYRIRSVHSDKVMDVSGYSTDNGGDVHQWSWHGDDNQRWRFEPVDGSDGGDDGGDSGSGPGTNRLVHGNSDTLHAGEHLESSNGDYRLYFQQGDGNLVIRATSSGDAKWASGTAGDGGTELNLQGDGNLVMRTADSDAIWASDTHGSGADELVLEDDGALVLYDDGSQVWAVNE